MYVECIAQNRRCLQHVCGGVPRPMGLAFSFAFAFVPAGRGTRLPSTVYFFLVGGPPAAGRACVRTPPPHPFCIRCQKCFKHIRKCNL